MNAHNIKVLTEFFRDAPYWDYLWSKVASELQELPEELRRGVALGLGLMLATDDNQARKAAYGPFQPIFVFEDRASAPPLAEIDEEMRRCLTEIADITEPAAAARFNDLLWALPVKPRPAARARKAVAAYRSLADGPWPAQEALEDGTGAHSWGAYRRADCLRRALEIAFELRDDKLQSELIDVMMFGARACLSDEPPVGALFLLLEALAAVPAALRPNGLADAISEAMRRTVGELHGSSRLYDLAVQLAGSDDERRALRSAEVQLWVDASDATDGLEKLSHLQHALELARLHGVGDINDLRRRLDGLDPESFGLGSVSVPIELRSEEIESYLDGFVREGGWEASLRAFAIDNGSPPSGDLGQNDALVGELQRQAPLQFIIPTVIIDSSGRPIRHVVSDADHRAAALIRQETLGITLWGAWAPEILQRIFGRFGVPSRSELTAFFTTGLIDSSVAERMARTLELHLDGQYDEAAHLLVPRLETVIRRMAQLTGVPVSREAIGDGAGGVATLGPLLAGLGGRLDPSWIRYLTNALSEPTGLNLRNRICHGLLERAGPAESAILIHIACFLTLLSVPAREVMPSAPTGGDRGGAATPVPE